MASLKAVDEAQRWIDFGHWMVAQRDRLGLRRREAARRAKVAESVWRDLETGRKQSIGAIKLLPNPSIDVLHRVATALEVSFEELLDHAGRVSDGGNGSASHTRSGGASPGTALSVKILRLGDRDRRIVEMLVDALLEDDQD